VRRLSRRFNGSRWNTSTRQPRRHFPAARKIVIARFDSEPIFLALIEGNGLTVVFGGYVSGGASVSGGTAIIGGGTNDGAQISGGTRLDLSPCRRRRRDHWLAGNWAGGIRARQQSSPTAPKSSL
jgi:hypothetical protein